MEITVNGCKVEMTGLSDIISYKKRLYQNIVNLKEFSVDKSSYCKILL